MLVGNVTCTRGWKLQSLQNLTKVTELSLWECIRFWSLQVWGWRQYFYWDGKGKLATKQEILVREFGGDKPGGMPDTGRTHIFLRTTYACLPTDLARREPSFC